ncbi:MAG: GNAT family N-acetyltransferase [Anaerolineae bacterium]
MTTYASQRRTLRDGRTLLIRQAEVDDAAALLAYYHAVSTESDFLSFGAGEFEVTEAEEVARIQQNQAGDNRLLVVGVVEDGIVAALHFAGGHRPRIRHSGEFGISVRRAFWEVGIGGLLLDALIAWARERQFIKKIDLRVRTDNARAMRLYRSRGFALEGTQRGEILLDGVYLDVHWMGLWL